jgi:hypothetical protein
MADGICEGGFSEQLENMLALTSARQPIRLKPKPVA